MSAVPFSYRQYAGNGSTTTFSVPFPYLLKSHVKVYIGFNILDGTYSSELADGTGFTWSSGTQIQCSTAPASGQTLTVIRVTPNTTRLVDWQDGSNLISNDLDTADLQNLYVIQEQQDRNDAGITQSTNAQTAAAAATAASTTATTTANAASTAAATATTTANAASASAATALSQSNTAIANSASALTASANAVTTANTAATNAASAVTTAGTANTNATAAVNTANTAASNASTALSQSSSALSNSATALSTANTAASNASTALTNSSNAVTTANTANTNASNAVTTANTASTNATAALNAVASSLQYVLVANVAAIPSSPANNYAIEVADSTGVESFSPLANRPAGFVGDVGLSVRMQYSTTGPTWNWLNYFPNNAETRYLKLAGGTLTGQLRADDSTSVAAPVIAFDGDTNTGLAHTGADELALVTGGTARLTVDPSGAVAVTNALSVGGQAAVVTNDARLSDTRTPTDGSVTNAKVSASAAIAGSKISPDFGAQNVTTTGTSTAASFIPSSSTVPTNGVYLPAANSVAISTGGSQRLNIDANGRLNVAANSQGIRFGTQANISAAEGAELILNNLGAQPIAFYTNNSERLRITSAGFVGIGTSSVSDLLHVQGSTTAYIRAASTTSGVGTGTGLKLQTGSRQWLLQVSDTDTSQALRLYDETANVERLRIDTSGRLGIGTSTPGQKLSVAGGNILIDSNSQLRFGSSDAAIIEGSGSDGTGGTRYMRFLVNNEVARFDTSGRFLVGTSSASGGTNAKAIIAGNTNSAPGVIQIASTSASPASGDALGVLRFSDSGHTQASAINCERDGGTWTSGSSQPTRLVFSTTADGASSPTERFTILNSGHFKTGTLYNRTSAVAANVYVDSDTSLYRATSSGKYKTDVETLEDTYADALLACRPVWYRSLCEGDNPNHGWWGFIAEEVAEIDPRLVHWKTTEISYDDNGSMVETPCEPEPEGVQYDRFVPHLLNLIKRQKEQIEAMEARLTALETK